MWQPPSQPNELRGPAVHFLSRYSRLPGSLPDSSSSLAAPAPDRCPSTFALFPTFPRTYCIPHGPGNFYLKEIRVRARWLPDACRPHRMAPGGTRRQREAGGSRSGARRLAVCRVSCGRCDHLPPRICAFPLWAAWKIGNVQKKLAAHLFCDWPVQHQVIHLVPLVVNHAHPAINGRAKLSPC